MEKTYTDIKPFTRTEWEIIIHRLEAPDAIVDALTDHHPDDKPACTVDRETLIDEVDLLLFGGCKRDQFDNIEMLILRECCEGSTFFAGIDDAVETGEVTTGYKLNMYRAAKSLGEKLNVEVCTN